jgi:DNA polymerase elongation subunit (family B)
MERIPKAKELFQEYLEKIASGNVSKEELSIRQHISRRPSQYKVNSYQAVASKQAERSGLVMTPGKNVRYIILNADANPDFPQKKVILTELYDEKIHFYDKDKYTELLKRAFENIFPFEFPDIEDLIKKHRDDFVQKKLNSFF